ncbi:MAG: Ig-like domain-containing protein, partial [Cuspidothrix sp.]
SQGFLQQLFPDVDPDVWTQVQVTFVAGSAQDDGGNAATQAMIIPVDPNRLPAPLPPGVDPQLVISIQAGGANGFNREADGGATNFDVPAPIQFPNLEGLKPGEKSLFWSFDHDAGKWIVIGTGTVSEDGKTIKSDPGVGVLAPGWHFVNPGSPTDGPKPPPPCQDSQQVIDDVVDVMTTVADCAKEIAGIGKVINAIFEAAKGIRKLINNAIDLKNQIDEAQQQGKVVTVGTVTSGIKLLNDAKLSTVSIVDSLKSQNPVSKALAISKCIESVLGTFESICGRLTEKKDSPCNTIVVRTVCLGLATARTLLAKVNGLISKAEDGLKTLGLELVCRTIDQLNTLVKTGTNLNSNQVQLLTFSNLVITAELGPDDPLPDGVLGLLTDIISQGQDANTDFASVEEFGAGFGDLETTNNNLINDSSLIHGEIAGTPANSPYLIEYNNFQLRGKTNGRGQISSVLPRNTDYKISVYDITNNLIGTIIGKTALSGSATQIPKILYQSAVGLPDTDGEGLVDQAEKIIGTNANKKDTDNDGINDFAEIQQGLDPLGGQGFPTGIIASLPLLGEAKAVTVAGSITNSQTQTAYVATGSYGLAVVNASQFNNPTILGQLNLLGDATDVAVDTKLNIAAVASNSGGLHLVNVADGMLPTLNKTINLDANQVEIADGIAYATVDNVLHAIGLATGEELQNLTLPGSGTVTGLAREGTTLYSFVSGSDTFSAIDITDEGAATVLGQLNVDIASSDVGLSVGNGVAYLAGSGLRTINVSNPSSPTLISDADNFFTARGVTLNGSGLALVSAEGQGLAVYSSTDPTKTDAFLTVFNTPGFAYNAAIVSGIAFLADGSSGLQVINYLSFDNKGQAPTININTSAIDLDPNTTGIQIQEGTTIPILANILDDVQVRNVELLVNGQVISNDVSFPWDLSVIAPAITPDKNTVDIQVRATDTGGNTALSNTLTLNLSEDIFAPAVQGTTPSEGARRKEIPSIAIKFNEALDTTKLNLSGITLTNLGADGVLGGGDDTVATLTDLQTRNFDRTLVILTGGKLPLGEYQLKVDPSIISDVSGNALANPVTLNFTKRPLTTPINFGTAIAGSLVEAGDDEVYTFTGTVGQRLYYDGLINNRTSTIYARLISPSGQTLFSFNDADSDRTPFTLTEAGTYRLILDGSGDNTGNYSFNLIDASAATAITLGTTVTETLTPGLQADIYRINGTAGQRLYFDSLAAAASNATWTLYGPGNQSIAGNDLSNDFDNDFETTLTSTGTYLLVLDGNNSNGNINYSFKVTSSLSAPTTLTLGTAVTSTISQTGEIDEYTFTGAVGQRLYYDGLINNTTSTINAQLISPSGETVF